MRPSAQSLMTAAGALMIAAAVFVVVHHRKSPVQAPPARPVLRLLVERNDDELRLRWNPDAPEIRDATHAVLSIGDGGQESRLPLETAELQSGLAIWRPHGQEVTFRLEVAGGATGEIRVPVEPRPSPFGREPAPPAQTAAASPLTPRHSEDDTKSEEEPHSTYKRYWSVPPARPPEPKAAPAPAKVSTPVPAAAPPAPVDERASAPSRTQLVQRESVVVPAATEETAPKPSRIGRVVRKIPLLRRLHKEH